jgi:hypothetical protein
MKECSNCPGKKVLAKGLCNNCYDKQLKEINPSYRQKQMESSREWRKKNAEKVKEKDRARDALRRTDPVHRDKIKSSRLKREYSVSLEEYRSQLFVQNFSCAICECFITEGDKYTHIDHCHETGEVRGVLCSQCNWFMSRVDNNANTLANLINYSNNGGVWKQKG